MIYLLIVLLILASALLITAYWGAGIILYPPKMSPMSIFPEQFHLPYEKISFPTADGMTLRGWFIPSPDNDERTLLMCHGWGDNKGELLAMTAFLNTIGKYNLIYFDHRSHGESDGNITTIGCLETIDFQAVMDYLKANKPQCLRRLGLFGLSMGAAVGICCMPRHPEIKAAVLESPFTHYRQVVRRWAWNNLHIPYFPIMMLVLEMLKWRVGRSDVDDYSPIFYIGQIAPRPIMMIGGSDDILMTPADVKKLFAQAKEPKELWLIPHAKHAKCHETAGLSYEKRILEFFYKNL